MTLRLVRGDLVETDADAIVNAANRRLDWGGGVCGAIFNAAGGDDLTRACKAIGHCPTGKAVMTPGFKLKARHIIHTVGPVWRGGDGGEPAALRSCYLESLKLAADNDLKTVAFPLISSGIFGYPKAAALDVAISSIAEFLASQIEAGREALGVHIVFFGDVSEFGDPELTMKSLGDEFVEPSQDSARDLSQDSNEKAGQDPPRDHGLDSRHDSGQQLSGISGELAAKREAGLLPRLALASNMELSRLVELSELKAAPERSEVLALAIGLGWGPGLAKIALTGLGAPPGLERDWLVTAHCLAKGEADINRVNRSLFALDLPILP